jgi:flagellar hook assembly protein FlgD
VPLEVIAGPIMWKVTIKNNPFKGDGNGGDKNMQIVLSPTAKGDPMDLDVKIRIFNNMGNIVVDTNIVQKAQPGRDNEVAYTWKGLNKKGRVVGTGTYILRADCVAGTQRYNIQRMVGFVRGKN